MKRHFFLYTYLVFLTANFLEAQEVGEFSNDSQKGSSGVFVAAKKIKDSIYSLTYGTNNAVAFLGREYTLLVDGHDAKAAPKTLNTAGRLSLNPVRFLINTNHNKNNTGGNAYYSDSGVTVMCNQQTYNNIWIDSNSEELDRMKSLKEAYSRKIKGNKEVNEEVNAKYSKLQSKNIEQELPYSVFVISDNMSINLVNEKIKIIKTHNAHSSGDLIVFFKKNNVIACGDLFLSGKYPYIDEKMGGDIDNLLMAIDYILKIANDETVLIPGRGPIASKEDLKAYKRMIEYTQRGVQMDYLLGKTLEEVISNKSITANYDNKGYGNGLVKTQDYLQMLYRSAMKRYPKNK